MPGDKPVTKLDRCVSSVMKQGKDKDSAYAICQSSIGEDSKKSIDYRGTKFPGYNKPIKSNREGKKKMVLAKSGDKVKLVHYGDTGYKHNYSAEAKRNFRARHKCSEQKDKLSAAYWACKDLWPTGSTKKSTEKQMKDDPCWQGYEMVGHKMKNGKKVPNCVPKSTTKSGSFLMKKIELNNNETYSIKSADGETYVFHGGDLFIDTPEVPTVQRASILKSLRTERGAEDWLRLAGKNYPDAVIMDTETLKSFGGTIKSTSGEEDKDAAEFEAELPFHVVSLEDMHDMGPEEEMDALEQEPGDLEEDEAQEQEMTITQINQILHDAEVLYDLVAEAGEHLEPWMQNKLTKVSDYMNTLRNILLHEDGDGETEEEVLEDVEADTKGLGTSSPGGAFGGKGALVHEKGKSGKRVEVTKKDLAAEPAMMSVDSQKGGMSDEAIRIEEEGGDPTDNKNIGQPAGKMSTPDEQGEGSEKADSLAGKVFKSLHAARQWNRFENPDKDRYYIDILRQRDARKSFSKSTGLNAKYVVRDRFDDPQEVIKGAHGNRLARKSESKVAPEAKIDKEVRDVSGLSFSHAEVTEANSLPANSVPLETAPEANVQDGTGDVISKDVPNTEVGTTGTEMPANSVAMAEAPDAKMDSEVKEVSGLAHKEKTVSEPNSRPANTGEQPTAPEMSVDADVKTVSAIRD